MKNNIEKPLTAILVEVKKSKNEVRQILSTVKEIQLASTLPLNAEWVKETNAWTKEIS